MAQQPNLVIVLADDVGTDLVGAYGVASQMPCTPNLDALAAEGLLFRNAWSNASCSTSRASLMTGRYAFRHGIGGILTLTEPGLPYSEVTLPELLPGYASSAIGKWHMGGSVGVPHPTASGFDSFTGAPGGSLQSYFNWRKYVNGTQVAVSQYAVTDRVDDAVAAMDAMQEPWLLFVSFNTIHAPLHVPPLALCPSTGCGGGFCRALGAEPTAFELTRAMIEAMDTEIGRLLTELDARDPDAYVVFMGDNGSPGTVAAPPFSTQHGKGTLYEGGVNIPMIVKGPTVAVGECLALVGLTDLAATFAELAGAVCAAEDSISLVPYFADPLQRSLRAVNYSESFSPNYPSGVPVSYQRAVRDSRYKLLRVSAQPDEFYDLEQDPFESNNLLGQLTPQQAAAHDALSQALNSLLATEPQSYCTAGTSAAGCQALITSSGVPSATAPSGFTLEIINLEGQRDGMFFFGANGRQALPWGNSSSLRCVAAPVLRAGLQVGGGTSGLCDSVLSQDLNARWTSRPAQNPGAGAVVQAQFWYRDPTNTSNQTTSLSDALEFTVQP